MRMIAAFATIATVAAVVWWTLALNPSISHAEAGPTISVDQPVRSGANLIVPISASGSGFSPFAGFYVHLKWNSANFSFASMDRSAGLFGGSAAACDHAIADADGGVLGPRVTSPQAVPCRRRACSWNSS